MTLNSQLHSHLNSQLAVKLFGYDISVSRAPRSGSPVAERRSGAETHLSGWLRGEGYGGESCTNAFAQVAWVYRAVTALAESVANIPFRFTFANEADRRGQLPNLERFYARPHPSLNGFQYWEQRVMWLLLRGECFRVPVFRESHQGRQLEHVLMLDPSRFRHMVEDGVLTGWAYRSSGAQDPLRTQVLLPEEVWFERLANPLDPWRGLAPLAVAGTPASSEYAAGQWMRGLMENNGNAGVVVRTDEPLDEAQKQELREALRERRRGVGRADAPLLLWGGAEILQPKAAAADLNLIQHRRFSLAEICAAFGVPEEIVTTVSAAKFDIMKGSRLSFIENRVAPFCRRLEAEEQVCVRALAPGAVGLSRWRSTRCLPMRRMTRLRVAQTGFAMGVPFNELNKVLDLGFDELPFGDTAYVPANMKEV